MYQLLWFILKTPQKTSASSKVIIDLSLIPNSTETHRGLEEVSYLNCAGLIKALYPKQT